jgi:hypothetical protein
LIDSTNSGLRESANHDVLAGIVANTGEIYLNGVNKLLDSFLRASSDSQNGLKAEQLRVRQAEAIKKVGEAKKRIQALDDIDRARAIHENYIEMNEFRQSMRAIWMKTGECARDLEKACIAAFSHAEEQD